MINKRYLEKHLPPNIDVDQSHLFVNALILVGALLGFTLFLIRYGGCYNRLFYFINEKKIIKDGMLMCTFPKAIKGMCIVNLCSILCSLAYSLQLYSSFFEKSQSIYLMRRLPDNKRTLRHMIMDVPMRSAIWALVFALATILIAYIIWRFYTPAVCLPV